MKTRKFQYFPQIAIAALLLAAGSGFSHAAAPRTVKWVVAHARDDKSFSALLDKFAARVSEKSGGALKIEFIDAKTDSTRRDAEADKIAFQQLSDGQADMSQIAADRMGVKVIDEPYLFRSYEHAEAVWRSPTGQKLLSQVSSATDGKARALSFAYSGGYRIMVGQVAVKKLEDIKGARMRDTGGQPAEFLHALGVQLVKLDPKDLEGIVPVGLPAGGKVDLEETEVNGLAYIKGKYPEVVSPLKYANITRHSMLVTAMVVNEKFFASLTDDQRRLLSQEVETLAAAERRLSVSLAKRNIAAMAKDGLEVVALSKAEERRFAKVGEGVYQPEMLSLIREIQGIKEVPLQLAKAY